MKEILGRCTFFRIKRNIEIGNRISGRLHEGQNGVEKEPYTPSMQFIYDPTRLSPRLGGLVSEQIN